jgi:hypothetical protein
MLHRGSTVSSNTARGGHMAVSGQLTKLADELTKPRPVHRMRRTARQSARQGQAISRRTATQRASAQAQPRSCMPKPRKAETFRMVVDVQKSGCVAERDRVDTKKAGTTYGAGEPSTRRRTRLRRRMQGRGGGRVRRARCGARGTDAGSDEEPTPLPGGARGRLLDTRARAPSAGGPVPTSARSPVRPQARNSGAGMSGEVRSSGGA